ncbi:hypothetical protein [Streptomyces griseoloalbus]|uniref:Uncharacterized protein n=1 Tax=Streptomyces griseoloalbus TaxID=67303 RepID=A0A7W8FAR5_9ACTN|nr:hypothetical protein [Streptomyces albaduncus]MBB5127609.1 hypothetical protein [Streptomyces albaduncus]GGV69376.1 hypothetical protein GCM10010294_26190 [Streptomyces griseoloalbus]GGW62457.1 hypothetical protein GCM10010340_46010 [Streptomyces albaduncus]
MVTATHEASHRLFQEHPEALAPVFEALGLPPPVKTDFHELSPDVTEIRPMERRADTVLMFEPDMGEHFVLAVEAQTKKDPDKANSWSYYVAYLRAKYDLPVLLVVVCRDRSTAAWATGPFECTVGPWTTQVTRPFVLGPQTVPEVTDETVVVQQPALAALSAIVHSESPRAAAILETVARGLVAFAPPVTGYWFEVVEVGLMNTPHRENWRQQMNNVVTHFPGHKTYFEQKYLEGKAEGEAKGEAKGILRVLEVRGLPLSDDVRQRITTCTDLDRLNDWLDRSGTVQRAEDLFAEEGPAS